MRRRRILACLLGTLALVACGDDGSGSDTSGPEDAGDTYDASDDIALAGDADEGIDGVLAYRISSADHVGGSVEYPVVPPPGGPHNQVWVNCGFHDEPFADENLVHDLEHGAVWLAYSPDLAAADVDVIRGLAEDHKVVAAPHEGLDPGVAVVASAWARQLVLDSVDDERLQRFVVQYEDGSQAPESGVTCTGTPLG